MPKKVRGAMLVTALAAERAGVSPATWRKYGALARDEREAGRDRPGLLPPPDGWHDARTPWWYESTVDKWMARRPGAGARTDLAR
jgi:hypothetical protein